MTTNIFNVKHAVTSNSEILSLLHQFWTSAPVTNISTVYTFCVLAIGLCMYAAGCRNLIYKVLNLAVLSVFVVALWAYLTDITFIYVVYILTFVSAVVMLFLSVVLMLPSSAISVSTKGSTAILSVFTVPYFIETALSSVLFVGLFLFAYLGFAFYRTRRYTAGSDLEGEPKQTVKIEYAKGPLPDEIKSLESNYILKTFSRTEANNNAVESCLSYSIAGTVVDDKVYTTGDHQARIYSDASLSKYIAGVGASSYPLYVRVYPKYFFNSLVSLQDYRLVRSLLTVAYEFIDFYFRVLEPTDLLRSSKLYTKATSGLKKFVGIEGPNRPLPTLWYDQNGWRTQCRLYLKNEQLVIFVFHRPWWSPFQVFRTPSNLPIFASSLQSALATIEYYASAVKDKSFIKSSILYLSLRYALKFVSLIKNMLASLRFSFNGSHAELAVQVSTTLSVFLLAAPLGYSGATNNSYSSHVVGEIFSESLENLAAIQQQLYVVSPLFMIVSVTGLLVALIGAPLFVSPGHATKKEVHKH